ncbi:MAG: hypothetical protein R3C56_32580 [Pirellulaceae bacterium]
MQRRQLRRHELLNETARRHIYWYDNWLSQVELPLRQRRDAAKAST